MAKTTQTIHPLEAVFKALGTDVGRIAEGLERIEKNLPTGSNQGEASTVTVSLPSELVQLAQIAPDLLEGIKLGQQYLLEKSGNQGGNWQEFLERCQDFLTNRPDLKGYQIAWQAKIVIDDVGKGNGISGGMIIEIPAHLHGKMGWVFKKDNYGFSWKVPEYQVIPKVIRFDEGNLSSDITGHIYILQATEEIAEIHLQGNTSVSTS